MTTNLMQGFYKWLQSDEQVCVVQQGDWTNHFVRVRRDKFFDLIYHQSNSSRGQEQENLIRVGEPLKYVGMYCRKDRLLYDMQYELYYMLRVVEREEQRKLVDLGNDFKKKAEDQIIQILGDDPRSQLSVKELTSNQYIEGYKSHKSYYAEINARDRFMNAEDPYENQDFELSIWLDDEEFTKERILAYILSPENMVQKAAKTYIAKKQDELLFSILCRDATKEEYEKILADPGHELHIARKIQNAVWAPSIKNVNVTLDDQNGGTFTFKMEARGLRGDCKGGYCTIGMLNAKDEKLFESFYGDFCSRFSPKDVVRIEYRRKTLYQRED